MALLAILTITAALTLRSPWFHEKVRQRIVAELERATGGTVMLGDWVVDWRRATVQFQELTLHGTEPASVPPLLHARSVQVGLKIVSFWKQDVDIRSLAVTEPQVNIILAADGSTNIPVPKVKKYQRKIGLEPILDWKIGRIRAGQRDFQLGENKHGFSLKGEKPARSAFLRLHRSAL